MDEDFKKGPGLIQTFINTGRNLWKWRVLSYFGEPLYSSITRSAVERASLDASDEEIEISIIDAKNSKSSAADTDGTRDRLAIDEGVVVIEVNAGGNIWHFSSSREGHRERLGGRQVMINQFGAWTAATKALVRLTYANAT